AEDCLKQHNLTSSQVESVPPSRPVDKVPRDIQCYSRCVIDEYFGEDDKIDLKRLENRARTEEIRVLADCKQKYDPVSDRCEYAYLILQCLHLGKSS
ncbi:hypothetical protein KR018_007046, partial [Drosophila ironensis]